MFRFGPALNFVIWQRVNPFPNKPWFLRVCSTSLLKTLWEKEKLLVTSNFSFSHSVFYPFKELSANFIKLKIVICKLFQFGSVRNLLFGKGLKYVLADFSSKYPYCEYACWNKTHHARLMHANSLTLYYAVNPLPYNTAFWRTKDI